MTREATPSFGGVPARDPRRVLLIDDSEGILDIMAETLRAAGYQVGKALDGAEAMRLINVWRPDGIVLDRQMPVMDGDVFFKMLRAHEKRPPVLIVSGFKAEEGARELGAHGWLDKPFDLDDLVTAVDSMFEAGTTPAH